MNALAESLYSREQRYPQAFMRFRRGPRGTFRSPTLTPLLMLALPVLLTACSPDKEYEARQQLKKEKAAAAAVMFKALCETSGEKINRTDENIQGVLLMRVRPEYQSGHSQFGVDDPYGRDFGGEGYISTFLRGVNGRRGETPRPGYDYVDAVDSSGNRYRYTLTWKATGPNPSCSDGKNADGAPCEAFYYQQAVVREAPTSELRYGVTYEDISTHEQKQLWIAGSSLRVIDLKTQEIIAERVGFMRDLGMGADGGGRSPWLYAADAACPPFGGEHGFIGQSFQTARFVHKVLKPSGVK